MSQKSHSGRGGKTVNYVIIGASAAGLNAARTVRDYAPEDGITVVSADTQVHSRCMLHRFLGGERTAEQLDFMPDGFFESAGIRWLKGRKAEKVDSSANTLVLDDGSSLPYDKLLIASGACYVVPPIGALRTASNVYGFRDLSDAQAIDKAAAKGSRCVIVGSGLVGLDAANALCARGVECSVVEMADRISPLQLDAAAAKPYQQLFEQAGCRFYLSEKASGTREDGQGNITALTLESGKVLPCDFVIAAAGVRPNIGFLADSGIETDRCVKVDQYMRTNVPNVWAAGDVAGITGIWPNAVHQGETAAKNMCGIPTPYEDRYGLKNTMNFYGLTTLSLGADTQQEGDEVFVRESRDGYRKLVLRDGVVVHVLMQGDISNTGFWQELVKNRVPVKGIRKSPFDISYADFYKCEPETGLFRWAAGL